MTEDQTKMILDYLKTQLLGVLATVSEDGRPQAALVAVTELPDLSVIFGTANTTRKYANLQREQRIAITVGHDVEVGVTVQYEGVAAELSGEELERYRARHLTKNPRAKKFAFSDTQRFFKVRPTWIRYSNLAAKPPLIFELSFP